MYRQRSAGFTLVELSIVLVIIGLLVGAVLVGRDMIHSSQIRSQITQIQKYSSAVNTFRVKFNCLPGDCRSGQSFGLVQRDSIGGRGDGNGLIEGDNGTLPNPIWQSGGETMMFWSDLANAQLIDFQSSYTYNFGYNAGSACNTTATCLEGVFPHAKLGQYHVFALSGVSAITSGLGPARSTLDVSKNYFHFGAYYGGFGNGPLASGLTQMTALEAYDIDKKSDDGFPQTGKIQAQYAYGAGSWCWACGQSFCGYDYPQSIPATNFFCFYNRGVAGASTEYSVGSGYAELPNCALIRAFE